LTIIGTSRRPVPTINDVARKAGVSKGLVSFVINNRPGVAPKTRERVLQVASEMGWRPSVTARMLSTRKTFALGLVMRRAPQILAADPFFPAFMAGVESVLAEENRVLVLSVVPDAPSEERAYRSLAADHRVDGIFVTDLRHLDRRIELAAELALPAVTLGRPDVPTTLPAVDLDDTHGIEEAIRHLVALGHRRIAHVTGDLELLHARRRRDSFRRATRAAGLEACPTVSTDFSAAGGAAATSRLLTSDPAPTAIVYANDPMAIAGLGVLAKHGLPVPREMSVVGFDGTEMARYVYPALTTIEADAELWGAAAARTLLTLITEGQSPDVVLPPARLVLGDSTAPPPTAHPDSSRSHP
jgi:DNA-binding LacI/PurR family transcriptional regulator